MNDPWLLDPAVTFLNHGSFGSCPRPVLDEQSRLRERLEREPVRFYLADLERMLDEARRAVAPRLGVDTEGLVFVPNATFAVSSVLASLGLGPGDEIVVTDHGYNACSNATRRWAARAGGRVVVAPVPFPLASPDEATGAVAGAITRATRLVLVDHVTSPTGLVLPVADIVREAEARGVDTLVDGAHAPGMLPLDVRAIGAAYYTGNFHKWVCAPKGAGFLWVRGDRRDRIEPAVTSHGANSPRTDRSRYLVQFDWTGTADPTAILCVPAAYRFLDALHPDGLAGVMRENRALALRGRAVLCGALGVAPPAPEAMIGSLASVPLPPAAPGAAVELHHYAPPKEALFERHRIEVPVLPWPRLPARLLRVSAQRYNRVEDYERLAAALVEELGRG